MSSRKNKKKINVKLDKNKLIWLSIIIVSIIVIIIALALPKDNKENNKNNNNTTPTPSPTDTSVQEKDPMPDYYTLINYLNISELPDEYFGYFYKKNSYTGEEISNKVKVYMGIRKVIADNASKYQDTSKKIELSASDVEKAIKQIFGTNTKFTHESLEGNSTSYSNFKYKNNKYIQTETEEEYSQDLIVFSELKDQVINEEKVEITIGVLFVSIDYNVEQKKVTYSYYSDINKENLVSTSDTYSTVGLEDKCALHKFTFVNKNGQYTFEKVEKIN